MPFLTEELVHAGSNRFPCFVLPRTAAVASTDTKTAFPGTVVDAAAFDYAAFTFEVTSGKAVTVYIQAASFEDFSDAVDVASANMSDGERLALQPNITGIVCARFLRAAIKSTETGQHGTVRVFGVFKRPR